MAGKYTLPVMVVVAENRLKLSHTAQICAK